MKKDYAEKIESGWITSGKKNVGTDNLYRMYSTKIKRICKWDMVVNALCHSAHNDLIFYRSDFNRREKKTSTDELECNMRTQNLASFGIVPISISIRNDV